MFITFGCIKNDPPIKPPVSEGDDGGGNACKCEGMAKGTIEMCHTNQDVWFINANHFPLSSFAPEPTKLLLPDHLPSEFKVNGLTVSFKYTELNDSVKLICGRCGTPPIPHARKIKLCSIEKDSNVIIALKPNIYLYPTQETKVEVKLNYQGKLLVSYPDYDNNLKGWSVIAKEDGTLKNSIDKLEYQYLFWEGIPTIAYDFNMNDGYCVKGNETKSFLQNILPKMGLNSKEYNEMIVFWLPQMINNPYNLIHFAKDEYTKSAPLTITPKPDNIIRVFMAYQPSNVFVKTNEPFISSPQRKGFTVVEWGGAKVPKNKVINQPL